jgi:hypothetical protein
MHLTVNARIDKSGANFKTIWNEFKGVTEISIDLPQTVYAGKSVKVEF